SAAFASGGPLTFIQGKFSALEKSNHGRLGVYAIDTANNRQISYHERERFPLCSTNKVMGVAAILKKSEVDWGLLSQKIKYRKSDLVTWSPVTEKHVRSGMTNVALAVAAITLSDNAAINLLMKQVGGPRAVTAFAQTIGDHVFRLDRWEPELNSAIPGDLRDTTTPLAMGTILRKLVLGDVLAPYQRRLFRTWLIENKTGNKRIRAGVPKGWVVGDKTGTCAYGTTNDIGVVWGPSGQKIVLAIYFTQLKKNAPTRDDVIDFVTKIILQEMLSFEPDKS
ncbi:MAG: class A beta-lactamase, partial [Bacteroidetes bacterium]|nr:class A beta-lactamase [Bacteroidota bacterium]